MAGHSKWANIQHRKNAQDAKRGKLFTKLIREITTAAKMAGGDINANPRLRLAVDKALGQNMTRDTIDRAIKRGAGDDSADNMAEIRYEGYAAGGVAVLVYCLTDNKNRTVSEVRHAFTKNGGQLAADGAVSYLFAQKGILAFAPGANEDQVMLAAIEGGADDVVTQDDGSIEVYTSPENFAQVKQTLETQKLLPANAEITMVPANYVSLDKETAEKVVKLQNMLEDLDDVQEVYTNADIAAELL